MTKIIKIAIIGLGQVGNYLYRELNLKKKNIEIKKGKAKIELAVAKGKKQYDKRATKKNRDWNREKSRYIRKSS